MGAMVDQDFRHWSSTAAAADVTLKGLVVQTLSPDLDSGNKKTRNFVPLKVVGARVSQKIIINLLKSKEMQYQSKILTLVHFFARKSDPVQLQ